MLDLPSAATLCMPPSTHPSPQRQPDLYLTMYVYMCMYLHTDMHTYMYREEDQEVYRNGTVFYIVLGHLLLCP